MLNEKGLAAFLRKSIRRHDVPGASFAVLRNDRIVRRAQAGVVNLDSKIPVTDNAVFQIGSITKPLTATLVMQLVDEGLVGLDAPLVEYLPDFRVARLDVSQTVTIRELLCHTSGIDGDLFVDTGRGDESIRRFMDRCTMVPSLFERGAMMSYCNLGFAALGRVLEVVRNKPFDQVMVDHLFKPLGMKHAFASPEHAIRFNCAIGHVPRSPTRGWQASTRPYLSFGQAAAGSVPSMSANDLLQVARLHLNAGRLGSGSRMLTSRSARAMQRRQIKLPRHAPHGVTGWGLGWFLMNWNGQRVYGHDGGTIGQFAYLRIFPEKGIAVALLTNGGRAGLLFDDVCNEVISPLVLAELPVLPAPLADQPDYRRFEGRYENMGSIVDIKCKKDRLMLSSTDRDTGQPGYKRALPLVFLDSGTARLDGGNAELDKIGWYFTNEDESGRPRYVQSGFRQLKRSA